MNKESLRVTPVEMYAISYVMQFPPEVGRQIFQNQLENSEDIRPAVKEIIRDNLQTRESSRQPAAEIIDR